MLVRINHIRGEPAVRAMAIGKVERQDDGAEAPRPVSIVLVSGPAEIPPENWKPSNVEHVTEAEVDENEPGIARALADGLLVQCAAKRGRPRKQPETPPIGAPEQASVPLER